MVRHFLRLLFIGKYMTMNPIVEEYKKCYASSIYFIEHYLTTYDATSQKQKQFITFPRQKVFLKTLSENKNVIAIKHRQAGITTTTSAWIAWKCVFAKLESPETVLCIANQKAMAQDFLSKIITFIEQAPRWVWGSDWYHPDPKNPKNFKPIFVKKNQSEFELFNGCKGYARSAKKDASRGVSGTSLLAIDEAAFIEASEDVFASALSSTITNPKARTIMVSTPNGKDRLYYKTYMQALSGENNFKVVDFFWWQDLRFNRFLEWHKTDEDGTEHVIKEEVLDKLGNIPYDEKKWENLKKDGWNPISPWYIETCRSLNNDRMRISQEIEISFVGSTDSVIAPEIIERHRTENVIQITDDWELRDPIEKDTWIWEPPIEGHRYILAADVSTGSAEDATAIEIIDCDAIDENGMPYFNQVLEYNGNRVGGDEIANMIDKYGRAYNDALAVIDCGGGYGDACVLGLEARKYPNLYREDPNLKDYTLGDTVNKRKVKAEDERLPGFRTNAVRTQMLDKLRERLTDNSFRVRSMRVINELDTWVWKNGRPDHMNGFHDDTLTCLAMALFIMEFYMFRKLKNASKDAVMLRSWRSSKSFLTSEDINGAQPKDSLNISEQKPKYKMPFYSSGARERQIQKRTMAMLMLGGFKPKNF